MKWQALFFLLIIGYTLAAQNSIKGKVVNDATGAAVPGCSVFIANTSKGTTSNSEGYFELNDVPAGNHELVISSIGYETNVFSFSSDKLPLQLQVKLKIKVKELETVVVEPSVEEGWDKWGKTFLETFIGTTENAFRCKIRNTDKIKFRFYKKSNRLVAYADEPLKIENKALGYTINYQLEDFEINFKQGSTLFLGYPLFKESGKDRKVWERHRKETYLGSMMYFFRSLYEDSLKEHGFEVRRMWRDPNAEKERVKTIYQPQRITKKDSITGTMFVQIVDPPGLSPDSVRYYKQVLRQKDYIEKYGSDLLTADSLFVKQDGAYKLLYFPNYLFITCKNRFEEKAYLQSKMENRSPGFQQSFLYLTQSNPVWIERNGNYYNPRDIFSMGYWAWSDKMGDNLPLDYEP